MSIFKLSDSDADKTTEAEAAADLARACPMMVCGDVQAMRLALNEARNLYDSLGVQEIYSDVFAEKRFGDR